MRCRGNDEKKARKWNEWEKQNANVAQQYLIGGYTVMMVAGGANIEIAVDAKN